MTIDTFMQPHDDGCRCWPHVSEKDAHEAILQVARAEYLECREREARLRAALERVYAPDDAALDLDGDALADYFQDIARAALATEAE